jgi:hypothetical protein
VSAALDDLKEGDVLTETISFEIRLPIDMKAQLESLRRLYVSKALEAAGGHVGTAARLLGVSVATMREYASELGR